MKKMLMNISKFDLFSELFGDLCDVFWHYDWCPRYYLDTLTINLFSKKMNLKRGRIIVVSFSAIQIFK